MQALILLLSISIKKITGNHVMQKLHLINDFMVLKAIARINKIMSRPSLALTAVNSRVKYGHEKKLLRIWIILSHAKVFVSLCLFMFVGT